ncbi:hypothetical protein BT63DRAFT_294127 [Microthyrium microscopicum]|uniref:Uncharacterized protein n=1 Tax=Microthyrium microscopicum TaxID=703497 RepID=A0A6A6U8T8_9PEZI|nr:hypothetical protein BT63DRAFT_294127 [Microthyrium microscopicum]
MSHCERQGTSRLFECLTPYSIAECAVIIKATNLYRRATKWLVRYSYPVARGSGIANNNYRTSHPSLPETLGCDIYVAQSGQIRNIKLQLCQLLRHLSLVASTTGDRFGEGISLLNSEAELPSRPVHGNRGDAILPAEDMEDDGPAPGWSVCYTPGLHDIALLTEFTGQLSSYHLGPFALEGENLDGHIDAIASVNVFGWSLMDSTAHNSSCNACYMNIQGELEKILEVRDQIDGFEPPYWN